MRSELGAGSTIAGRYAVGDVLGRGGMGEVRAGRDLRLDRDVAIKLLDPDVAARAKTRERFEAEARAAARLNHPNIVLVYDSGEHEGVPFLVMERLPGRTLADELRQHPLSPERVRGVGADVLAALGAAHGAGVVHRDVKPGNVLLCPEGTVKVADFGIAKSVDDVDLTTAGVLLGTPAYLSPEQLAGEQASPASDIYSVGVLLYEALSGTKPFPAASAVALAHAVQTARPTPLRELRPDAPSELVAAIAKAMEKDPGQRFATAEAMAAALTATVAPPTGDTSSATERLSSTERAPQAAWRTEERRVRSGGVRALAETQRRSILVLAGVFAVVLLLAVVFTVSDNSPGDAPGVAPTTLSSGPASGAVPPDLDRAVQRLEAVVRP